MERGIILHILTVILIFTLTSRVCAQFTWTYDFESNTDNSSGTTVTQTYGDTVLTVSQPSGTATLLLFGGLYGTSGNVVYGSSSQTSLLLSFNKAVNLQTMHIAEGAGINDTWYITSDQGDSTGVSTNSSSGNTLTLNWAGIQTITILDSSISSSQIVVDNIVLHSETSFPVELIVFTATSVKSGVELYWQTATEVNNYGFEVHRRELFENNLKSEWEVLGFVAGHGNSNSPKSYEFIDENPQSGNLEYRLKQIDTDGSFEFYGTTAGINNSVTAINDEIQPDEFSLSQNYPNPFNPTTTINYSVPASVKSNAGNESHILLKVYDVLGKEVATLVNASMQPGHYSAEFNGANLPSGMYFYKLSVNGYSETRKMTLIK